MRLTENELNDIIKEEIAKLVKEQQIDEKLSDTLSNVGRGIKNFFSRGVKSGTKIVRGVGKGIASKTAGDLSDKQAAAAAAAAEKAADNDSDVLSTDQAGADDVDIMEPEQAGATVIDKETPSTVSTSTISSTPPPVSQTSATTNSDVKATFSSTNQATGEDNYRTKGFQALSSDDKLMSIFNKSPDAKKLYTDIITALSGDEEVLFKEQKEFDLSDRMNQLNLSQQERHELINAIDRLSKSAESNVVSNLGSSVMHPQTDTQADTSAKPADIAKDSKAAAPATSSQTVSQQKPTQKSLAIPQQIPDFVKSFAPQLTKLNPELNNREQDIQKVLTSLVKNKMLVSERVLNKKSKLKEQASGELKGVYDAAINRIDAKPNTDTNTSITYQDKLGLDPKQSIQTMDAQFENKIQNTKGFQSLVAKIKQDTQIGDDSVIIAILKIVFRNQKLAFNETTPFANTAKIQSDFAKAAASAMSNVQSALQTKKDELVAAIDRADTDKLNNIKSDQNTPESLKKLSARAFQASMQGNGEELQRIKSEIETMNNQGNSAANTANVQESKQIARWKKLAGIIKG